MIGERLTRFALLGLIVALIGVAWMAADPHALHDWSAIKFWPQKEISHQISLALKSCTYGCSAHMQKCIYGRVATVMSELLC